MFRNKTYTWCKVTVKREGQVESHEITSTPGHKYYLPNNTIAREQNERQEHDSYMGLSNKWVSAIHLKYGDRVLLSDDTYGIIESVTTLHLSTPETTYNFEVEDYHTYFVGNGVCVHNTGCESKQYYDSIKDHPNYPQDFQRVQNGKTIKTVKNKTLLNELRQDFPGDWSKIYNNGFATNPTTGQFVKVSLHYNQHARLGKIFDFEPHWGKWS